jgi:hypothetical protein
MASIREKAISILAGNLNSGHSYLIAAVVDVSNIKSTTNNFSPCYVKQRKFWSDTFYPQFT